MDQMDLREVLECSICLEQLSEFNKVLPCQHTFCLQCIQDVHRKQGELLCPECRTKVTVNISTLPSNIIVNRLLESLKQSQEQIKNNVNKASVLQATPVVDLKVEKGAPNPVEEDDIMERINKIFTAKSRVRAQNEVITQPVSKDSMKSKRSSISNPLPTLQVQGSPCLNSLSELRSTASSVTTQPTDVLNLDPLFSVGSASPLSGSSCSKLLCGLNTAPAARSSHLSSTLDSLLSECKESLSSNSLGSKRNPDDSLAAFLSFTSDPPTSPFQSPTNLPITGNLRTNPFMDLLDFGGLVESSNAKKSTDQVSANPGKLNSKQINMATKEWQLSPRAIITPPSVTAAQATAVHANPRSTNGQSKKCDPLPSRLSHSLSSLQKKVEGKVAEPHNKDVAGPRQHQQYATQQGLPAFPGILLPHLHLNTQAHQATSNFFHSASSSSVHPASSSSVQTPPRTKSSTNIQPQLTSSLPASEDRLYRAVYDYFATKQDELSLKQGELYLVLEYCRDGWFRGKHLSSGKTGVFPGNHVQKLGYQTEANNGGARPSDSSAEDTEAKRLENLRKIRENIRRSLSQTAEPTTGAAKQTPSAAKHAPSSGDRYRCIVPFPASSEYEIELQFGDVISLVKKREDGWCKGILHRTGKTGLFPASFVEKI